MFAISTFGCDSENANDYIKGFWERGCYCFEFVLMHCRTLRRSQPLFRISDVATDFPSRDCGEVPSLASANETERQSALASMREAMQAARIFRTSHVVFWPGLVPAMALSAEAPEAESIDPEKMALRKKTAGPFIERLCRSLFELAREEPDTIFCVPPARTRLDIPSWEELDWIIADLPHVKIRYWHNTAICHMQEKSGLVPSEAWLTRYGRYTVGIHLEDVSGGEMVLPGMGEVDFRKLKDFLPEKAIRVLRTHPRFGPEEIWACCDFLREHALCVM